MGSIVNLDRKHHRKSISQDSVGEFNMMYMDHWLFFLDKERSLWFDSWDDMKRFVTSFTDNFMSFGFGRCLTTLKVQFSKLDVGILASLGGNIYCIRVVLANQTAVVEEIFDHDSELKLAEYWYFKFGS